LIPDLCRVVVGDRKLGKDCLERKEEKRWKEEKERSTVSIVDGAVEIDESVDSNRKDDEFNKKEDENDGETKRIEEAGKLSGAILDGLKGRKGLVGVIGDGLELFDVQDIDSGVVVDRLLRGKRGGHPRGQSRNHSSGAFFFIVILVFECVCKGGGCEQDERENGGESERRRGKGREEKRDS